MAIDLTFDQQELLNNISKYEPAWRGFGNMNGGGFGNKMKTIIGEVNSLRNDIDIGATGVKEINVDFSSANEIEIFDGTSEVFISDIAVAILESFNTLATISIGTNIDNELLFSSNESDLNELNEFITFPKIKISDPIKLFFDSAGSSSGKAKIFINVR